MLRVLVERQHEFGQGMLTAYVDLKKLFDSVYHEALRDLLCIRRTLVRIIVLLTGLRGL